MVVQPFRRRYADHHIRLGFPSVRLRICVQQIVEHARTLNGLSISRQTATDAAAPPTSLPPIQRKEPDMPSPPTNGHPPETPRPHSPHLEKWDLEDVIAETEALRSVLQDVNVRTAHLLAALKLQRRQSRVVRAAMASLKQLQLGP